MDQLEEYNYFPTTIYAIKKPEFLDSVRKISKEYLEKSKENKCKENPMTIMTTDYSSEPLIAEFGQYISQTVWNILDSQGYAMDNFVTYFMEMWTQEHNFNSSMDQHVHGHGAQISVFYFLDVPKNSCKLIINDPRPAKVIINPPLKNMQEVLPASQNVVFTPDEGTMIFTPAWLPHQFTRNLNKKESMRFVHMNLSITQAPAKEDKPEVEII